MSSPAGSTGRPRLLWIVVAAVVAAALIALGVVLGTSNSGGKPAASGHSSTAPTTNPGGGTQQNAKAGPPVPAHGAYVGAWVKATPLNQQTRVSAVAQFEQKLGRPLDFVHTYRRWNEPFPEPSDLTFIRKGQYLQLSWAGTNDQAIISGQEDNVIRQRAIAVKKLHAPIFMEWRWEMDRPGIAGTVGTPADYIAAWKHIRAIFAREGVHNAAWVWCPTALGFLQGRAPASYPGDNQVDWICVDAYPGKTLTPMSQLLAPFLQWAAQHPKPIMIGEYGVPRSGSPQQRAQWLRAATTTFQNTPRIKAVSYFEANPAGHASTLAYVIANDPAAIGAFRTMAQEPYFNPRHYPITPR
ncbi:MAG: hypothetical protein ACRDQH_17025 [Pseudonocardiaceae bacterium]